VAFRLKRSDFRIMTTIAEYRILTVRQLVCVLAQNAQSVHRRLRDLQDAGLVLAQQRGHGRRRGRPEKIVSLTVAGVDALRSADMLSDDVPDESVTSKGIHCTQHQLLANWVQIHVSRIESVAAGLETRFLAAESPFLSADGSTLIADSALAGDGSKEHRFVPDGVFWIHCAEQDRTVLFFLEVDMGTEPLASPRRNRRDIRQKILNYQAYFQGKSYKRYEAECGRPLRGFRTLFVTAGTTRFAGVCQLVREMAPMDFIWVTEQKQLHESGVWGPIWARGGQMETDRQSILGSRRPSLYPKPTDLLPTSGS